MFSAARWRLTTAFTVALVLILLASGVAVYLTTRALIYDQVDAELAAKAESDLFLLDYEPRGPGGGPGGGPAQPEFEQGGYFFAVVDEEGNVIDKSGNCDLRALASLDALQQALQSGEATTETHSADGDTQRLFVLAATNDGEAAFLQMGRSIEPELSTLSRLRVILLAVIVISAVPASGGGYLLAGRALRPIKAAMDGQRAFIADASHELRTPVAVVRTNAELLERHMESGRIWQAEGDSTAVRDILSETERLGKMVGQMLTLAQSDAGQSILSQTDLILGELVEDAARSLRPLAAAKGVLMTVNAPPDVRVHGDGERLREVVVTVLDNAIKYTGAGGSVSISVKREHRKALVTVTDSGVGIPAEALRHVFERFYRVDKARSRDEGGTGLGLAIARQVVEAHGGHISIESEPGRGTTVIVELRAL